MNVSLADVTPGYTALEAGTFDIPADGSRDYGDVTFTCGAGGDNCTVTVAAGGTITARNSPAYQARLDAAAVARVAAAAKAAMTKEMAIAVEATQTAADGSGDDGAGGADTATDHAITVTRDRGGTTVTIAVDGAAADDPKFLRAMDLGGGRTMHVRTMAADGNGDVVEEVVIVSTDIEAPTATPFAMVPGQALNAEVNGDTATGDDAVAFDPGSALSSNDPDDATVLAKIMSSAFASGTGAELRFGGDDPADDTDEALTAAGSYNGATGTYGHVHACWRGRRLHGHTRPDGHADRHERQLDLHARHGRHLRRSGRRPPALRLLAEEDHGCPGRRHLRRGRDLCRFVGCREWQRRFGQRQRYLQGQHRGRVREERVQTGWHHRPSDLATFHGPAMDANSDAVQPHTVVGEFNADFSNGSVAGAFGARQTTV